MGEVYRAGDRTARHIAHPNVCRVYDIDDVDGRPFLSMEHMAYSMLLNAPLTTSLSAWHAGRSFVVVALVAIVAAFGFYTSLGGKPVFGAGLLEQASSGGTSDV